MDISIPYYEDMSRISNSNIGWYINKGPLYLHNKLTGKEKDESGPQLEKGTMIHEYLLQPEIFSEDYMLFTGNRPSSEQQKKFCNELINTVELQHDKAIISAYKASYSIIGKTDDKMLLEGSKIASELSQYINIVKDNPNKKLITSYDVHMLEKIGKNIKEHKLASRLLDRKCHEGYEIHNEFHINWEYTIDEIGKLINLDIGDKIKCKSLLDHVSFDFNNKVCTLVDLKTTVNIHHFKDSMDHYDYLRQLTYYKMAIEWYLINEENISEEELAKWKFYVYIIAIDTLNEYEVRVFQFEDECEFEFEHRKIITNLTEIYWHIKNNKWDHTISYYLGDGSEHII